MTEKKPTLSASEIQSDNSSIDSPQAKPQQADSQTIDSKMTTLSVHESSRDFDATLITRPDDSLLTYYMLVSLCSGPMFPFVYVPLWIRFKTMSYRFDQDGVAMSWGFFFRKEVYLTYGRLQDIHVTRNIIERWMGLAKVPIQTASGSHGATMIIEGIRDPEPLRDFLYSRMRGARGDLTTSINESNIDEQTNYSDGPTITKLLSEIRDELRRQKNTESPQ